MCCYASRDIIDLGTKIASACAKLFHMLINFAISSCTSLKKVDRFEGVKLNRVYTFPKRVYIHL